MTVGFGEDWLKLILSRTCIEESYFTPIFSDLNDDTLPSVFTQDQSFLLTILSEIINEQLNHIKVSKIFAFAIFQTLKTTLSVLNSVSPPKSTLPTGSSDIDALGYSLWILRDICASDDHTDALDLLISLGLVKLLLDSLRELEPPIMLRSSRPSENKLSCPYKGFRSDVVAIIGNCAYRRNVVQDQIREKNGILLMLQQCVTDDENPFLREWGIWAVRNLLEGNVENQRVVSELEVQGSVDLPELSRLGLRVEVDRQSGRAKLVNTGST